MPTRFDGKLVVAISSRALFDLDECHRIFEQEGLEAYSDYQVRHEQVPLQPGKAFPLVRKLLGINAMRPGFTPVEVVLLSRNSADTGLRVFNSIDHWGLPITRAAFSGGRSPFPYVQAFGLHLFLSTDSDDVARALTAGIGAAAILTSAATPAMSEDELRIAFDGDAVLFSDASERIYQTQGLAQFSANEKAQARVPMESGPFRPFLQALHGLQQTFGDNCPIRTALVTARSAPAHERVIRTLRDWKIRIDESLFLGGLDKGEFLKAFRADIFFDDQLGHCESAARHVPAGHVRHGVSNGE